MSITLVEFLGAVKGAKRETLALSVLYWFERYGAKESMTAAEVKVGLGQARVTGWKNVNTPDVLSKAGAFVDIDGNSEAGAKLWRLTDTGRSHVRALHGLPEEDPEIAHGVVDLKQVAAKISDPDVRAYVEESILCVSVGALRASIVYIWVAAVAELETLIWGKGKKAINAAILKGNPNAKRVAKKDDLIKLKEVELLQIAEDVGVLDKAEKQILDQALTVRNQSGHPNKYKPGVAKVKSHIEDITGILWI